MRKAHQLKTSGSSPLPQQFIFYDTETSQKPGKNGSVKHTLKLGWACFWRRRRAGGGDTEDWRFFTTVKEFWDFVEEKARVKTKIYLVAHSQAFDLAIVHGIAELRTRGWDIEKFYEKKPVMIITARKGKRSIVIMDNMNYFKGSLAALGDSIGLPKLDVNFKTVSYTDLKTYCRRDVEIMLAAWRRWLNFHEANELGGFSPTVSGQALKAFRRRFYHGEIYIHDRATCIKLERESYFGGRCECFQLGEVPASPVYYLDVNSMYPFVMSKISVPVKLFDRRVNVEPWELHLMTKRFSVTARVTVHTRKNCIPVRHGDRIVFPTGNFVTTLATPELILALRECEILKVHEIAIYEKAPVFREYVEFFYGERQKAKVVGDKTLEIFYKYLLNSLYGKFGQRSSSWETVGKADNENVEYFTEIDPDGAQRIAWRTFAGKVQRKTGDEESMHSFPGIAAHITSAARAYLWGLMQTAGPRNVYYVDTDSLFVNQKGYERLEKYIGPRDVGKLGIKKQGKELTLFGPKSYILDDKKRQKGIRRNAVKLAPGKYKQDMWPSLTGMMRKGQLNDYTVEQIVKQVSGEYKKGRVGKNGRVTPFSFPDDL